MSSNPWNSANDFETRLAHPLRLLDEWEVALFDVCYPEEWNHTGHEVRFAVAEVYSETVEPLRGEHALLEQLLSEKLQVEFPERLITMRSFTLNTGDCEFDGLFGRHRKSGP